MSNRRFSLSADHPAVPPPLDSLASEFPHFSKLAFVPYQVVVSTCNCRWAGTDRDVEIRLFGDLANSEYISLCSNPDNVQSSLLYSTPNNHNPTSSSNPNFPIGSVRQFQFNAIDVGNVVKISIKHDPDAQLVAAWKPERIIVSNNYLHRSWAFSCSRWLSLDIGNTLDLTPNAEIYAGRRASRRASRRLSSSKPKFFTSPNPSQTSTPTVETMRHRFEASSPIPITLLSKGSESGTRRVCFQLQKFTQTSSHVYLLGGIPALGAWQPHQAIRMTMHNAADGNWRGEWRLELEIDDDFSELQYTYMVVNESDPKERRRVTCPDQIRVLNFSAELMDRPAEGGRILVKDSFGCNKLGLPSASTPRSVTRKPCLQPSIHTPMGEAMLVSGALRPSLSPCEASSESENVQRNLSDALESISEDPVMDSESMLTTDVTQNLDNVMPEDGLEGIVEDLVEDPVEDPIEEETDDDDQTLDKLETASETPSADIHREEESLHSKEWEEQLYASDGQLRRSAQGLRRRQSEVLYLKKRNSQEIAESPIIISSGPSTPEKTSPVSSEGLCENDQLCNVQAVEDLVPLVHVDNLKLVVKERDQLAEKIKGLEEERMQKEAAYADSSVAAQCLQEQLDEMRSVISGHCEEYENQHIELVRLIMDEKETYYKAQQELIAERDMIQQKWAHEFKERRKFFNIVQELRGNIRVFCRVRPLKERFSPDGTAASIATEFPDFAFGEHGRIHLGAKSFEFDHVFQPTSSQQMVYNETSGVVTSVLDGFNVCVFAYGQTGSGKTYTMDGSLDDRGVNYRALLDLFDMAEERTHHSSVVFSVSLLEIYNEGLRDLILPSDASNVPKLEIRKDPNATSPTAVYVPNLTEVEVDSVSAVWDVMEQGARNRSIGKTNMNEHSSRSHLILKITATCEELSTGVKSSGVLHLVDLAGSERVARSNASGDRLKEARHINKSLASLGDVFSALTSNSTHVPYRNSRLTYLLQDCLGGDSKTLMFVNISADESDASESITSLQFAQRVAKVELGTAKRHLERTGEKKAIAALQGKELHLQEVKASIGLLETEVKKKDKSLSEMMQKTRALEDELKIAKKGLEDRSKRESAGREGMAKELREVKATHEKSQQDVRSANQRVKIATAQVSSKDEEIRRLQALLSAKEKAIVARDRTISDLSKRPSSGESSQDSGRPPTFRMQRPVSAPTSSARKPERCSQSRLPRCATTFTPRPRTVRFEDQKTKSDLMSKKDDAALLPPPPTPGAARRVMDGGGLPRSQTFNTPQTQRPTTVSKGSTTSLKKTPYTYGSHANGSTVTDGGTVTRPTRNNRLPRAQTNILRPAQRVQQPPGSKKGQPGNFGSGRTPTPGLRRAGTMTGASRSIAATPVAK